MIGGVLGALLAVATFLVGAPIPFPLAIGGGIVFVAPLVGTIGAVAGAFAGGSDVDLE